MRQATKGDFTADLETTASAGIYQHLNIHDNNLFTKTHKHQGQKLDHIYQVDPHTNNSTTTNKLATTRIPQTITLAKDEQGRTRTRQGQMELLQGTYKERLEGKGWRGQGLIAKRVYPLFYFCSLVL
jgi:hypothetical protein